MNFNFFAKKPKSSSVEEGFVCPEHIAVIMDGNGRWATKRKLPRSAGHYKGADNLRNFINDCLDFNIKYITLYAFSTENWKRPKEEVNTIMQIFVDYFAKFEAEFIQKEIHVDFIGDLSILPEKVVNTIEQVRMKTKDFNRFYVQIAMNYGARLELSTAVKNIITAVQDGQLTENEIDENTIRNYLYSSDIPDPDLFIRVGGEKRLSNFLLWQMAYTELYFADCFWPDFKRDELVKALKAFSKRERRFGGVNH